MKVKEIVRDFIYKNLVSYDENIVIEDDDDFFKLGFVNSLFAVRLVSFIENKMEITIQPQELDISNFNTITNIENLILKKIEVPPHVSNKEVE